MVAVAVRPVLGLVFVRQKSALPVGAVNSMSIDDLIAEVRDENFSAKRLSTSVRNAFYWRLISIVITLGFLWLTTGSLGHATIQTILLHSLLFTAQVLYEYFS